MGDHLIICLRARFHGQESILVNESANRGMMRRAMARDSLPANVVFDITPLDKSTLNLPGFDLVVAAVSVEPSLKIAI